MGIPAPSRFMEPFLQSSFQNREILWLDDPSTCLCRYNTRNGTLSDKSVLLQQRQNGTLLRNIGEWVQQKMVGMSR